MEKKTSNVVIKLLNKYNKCQGVEFLKSSSRVMKDKVPLGKDIRLKHQEKKFN